MQSIHEIYAVPVLEGAGSFEEHPLTTEELTGRRADVLARGLPYLVEELDAQVVGYAAPYRMRSA
jgi:phosphinothricin acetyltransferase